MKKTSSRLKNKISLPGAATLLVVTMLMAQLLGFLRTMLVNGNFPVFGDESTDAYFAAFKIPDFFFYVLAAGVLSVVLIPILSERMSKSDRRGVWELSNSLMNLLALVTFVIGIFILIFAEQLMHIVAPDLTPEQLANGTAIMRLIAFNPLFFTLSGILTSTQQVFGRFFFFAITPIVYNICIIASIFIFKDSLGLVGLGVGALVGGLTQFLVALLGVTGLNFYWKPRISFKNHDFRRILRQLPARSVDQGIDSVNSIVETNRARALGEGFVSAYENAFVLHTAPILLIGSSISTAAFPRLSARLAQNRPDLFRKEFTDVLRFLIWIALPTIVIAYFARGYLARLIFKRGSPEIALILGFLAAAIFFRIIYTLLSRYFYAHKDTATPLIISIFAIALNIILVFALARPEAYGAAGLAIAQSIVAAAEVIVIGTVIYLDDRKLFNREFWQSCLSLISVTGFTIIAAYIMIRLLPLNLDDTGFFLLGSKLGAIIFVTFTTHVLVSALLGFDEGKKVFEKLSALILKPIKIYQQ
jgi:putative peptidoglycan lipid II flippase